MLISLLALAPATIIVDTTKSRPISPYIYGANFAPWERAGAAVTLNRQGGNRLSAYNWETNASNAGNDFKNQNDAFMGESDEPGLTVRTFLKETQAVGAATLLTVPTMGYVAADKKGDGDVGNTPNYLATRFVRSFAKKREAFVYPPDIHDRAVYQDEFVHWVETIRKPSPPVWYSLDNEPDLWGSTHSRVWKQNPTYTQIVANNAEFASAIKAQAPGTLVFGPANYGWQGFRSFQNAPDADGRDFVDYYLGAMKAESDKVGRRLIDVFDIHWYPEAKGGGQRIAFGDDKPGTAEARIQAPRSLWDSTYVEDSWIEDTLGHKPIRLLPRLIGQIEKAWPGTRLGITEYNYGGGKAASGMLAEADVLGVFGREGLFAACVFGMGKDDAAQIAAFKAFRDYDGRGSHFGSEGLAVVGTQAADESLYASRDAQRIVMVAINKTTSARPFMVALRGETSASATGYGRSSGVYNAPMPVKVGVAKGMVSFTAAPLSVVTVEVKLKQ